MPCQSHPLQLDHSDYTWWRVQVMKLLILSHHPFSFRIFPSESGSQTPSVRVLPLISENKFHTHAKRISVTWVHERTIPTERPPLVGEVSANVWCWRVSGGQRDWSPLPYSRISRPDPLLFLSSSSSVVVTRLSGPRSRRTTSQKIWQRRESNTDLWICSQEFWPLDHRGSLLSST
jgi:hypothetical protein